MALTTQATRVVEAAETFLAAVSEFEPASAPAADCVAVAAAAARVEKGASGLRVLAGAHAVEAGAHIADGVADPVSRMEQLVKPPELPVENRFGTRRARGPSHEQD